MAKGKKSTKQKKGTSEIDARNESDRLEALFETLEAGSGSSVAPKIKPSRNQYMKEYRRHRKEEGKPCKGGPRGGGKGRPSSLWNKGYFIALDGEGESYGEPETFTMPGKGGKSYRARQHRYTLLAAFTGESLYSAHKALPTKDCLNFLCDLGDAHKKGIFVIFAGAYDVNHILMEGFDRETLQKISRGETVELEIDGVQFNIEYRARKSLVIRRGLSFKDTKKGVIPVWDSRIVIWDVFGFFQASFVHVMEKWLGSDWHHYNLIKSMKSKRGDFASVDQSLINKYNQAELETLVEIMNRVREAITRLDLKITRWDGAGALAAALMRKHDIKQYKKITPDEINTAVRTAYAGGRIEVCKIGTHNAPVYDYDVNSAYPSIMQDLPCLAHGKWVHGGKCNVCPPGFTLAHVKFDFVDGLPFYPFFYRNKNMQICYPQSGEGWYWYPEYKAAQDIPGQLELLEYWHFIPGCEHKPFSWIGDYYETRKQWVANPTEDWQKGAEKIIKLGLNSLYGKTAQQVGSRDGAPPAYHQLEWAGYITSSVRSKIYTAARYDADAIIGFATDGIFSTRELSLELPKDKELGGWDLQILEGITIVMSGVYWWHLKNQYKNFSRGFDKEIMETPQYIFDAWKKGEYHLDIPMQRLIGMGTACTSDIFWKLRGKFTDCMRTLQLNGECHKRDGVKIKESKLFKQLVNLPPSQNIELAYGMQECSYPYPLQWETTEKFDEFLKELEMSLETDDTDNI